MEDSRSPKVEAHLRNADLIGPALATCWPAKDPGQ